MGMIIIEMRGSFPQKDVTFKAQTHGHAHAVNEAISWLTEQMTEAINKDHQLHSEGVKPTNGFGKE